MPKQKRTSLKVPLKTVVVHRNEVLLVDADEAARILAIGKRKLWSETNCGNIPCVRIGRAVRYSVEALRAWISKQSTESGGK
jgi:excisionase family DNA binding protein